MTQLCFLFSWLHLHGTFLSSKFSHSMKNFPLLKFQKLPTTLFIQPLDKFLPVLSTHTCLRTDDTRRELPSPNSFTTHSIWRRSLSRSKVTTQFENYGSYTWKVSLSVLLLVRYTRPEVTIFTTPDDSSREIYRDTFPFERTDWRKALIEWPVIDSSTS